MLGSGTSEEFFQKEFQALNLKDKRLHSRALEIYKALQMHLTSCIKRLFIKESDMRQAYDFFSNHKVTGDALIEPHYKKTAERVNQVKSKYILSIQDNTILNFTSHKAKTEFGRIGRGKKTAALYGTIQHSTILVTDKNEPLGIIDLQHFDYDDFDLTIDRHKRSIEEKHSICWITASKNRRKRLANLTLLQKIITVCDREGDFFEFLYDLHSNKESYVIRAQHDRFIGEKHSKKAPRLFKEIENEPVLGEIKTTINDVATHQIKEITLSIKRLRKVTIPPTAYLDNEKYTPITLNAVMAYNDTYCWILLTDLPVDSLADCEEIITIYKSRWHIEDYHKILKTAYQIDEVYLHSSKQAIINALTMISISACRLYWIIYVGRVESTIQADELFEEYEWKAVYVYFKEEIPDAPPPLSEIIIKIAKMGGYKDRKNSQPPGIKLMWLGFQVLTTAAIMYDNILSIKT